MVLWIKVGCVLLVLVLLKLWRRVECLSSSARTERHGEEDGCSAMLEWQA